MIKLRNSSITILSNDGTGVPFDPDELEAAIKKSCRDAGISESWVAEDIALALEFSLIDLKQENRVFSAAELNNVVIKILQETGYPEAAESFRKNNHCFELFIKNDRRTILGILSNNIGLAGTRLENICAKIVDALSKTGIPNAPHSLIMELGKYYSSGESAAVQKLPEIKRRPQLPGKNLSPWLIQPADIYSKLPENVLRLTDSKVLIINGISRLFPAVKVDLSLCALAEFIELNPPVSEMAIIPSFQKLAAALNSLMPILNGAYAEAAGIKIDSTNMLPFSITVSDLAVFAEKWLEMPLKEAGTCCYELMDYLNALLDHRAFTIKLR